MEFNVELPGMHTIPGVDQPWSAALEAPDYQRIALEAEDLGFDAIMATEHLALPAFEVPRLGATFPHAMTVMSFVAGATRRIRVDSFVLVLPYHHPVALAKAVATLDRLSGGRVTLSVGVGHAEQEFAVLGVPFHERGRYADEQLEVLKACWTNDRPTFHGRYFTVSDVAFAPHPVQKPYPPIHVGGNAPAALRRAARHDGWLPNPDRTTEGRANASIASDTLSVTDIPRMLGYIREQPEYQARTRPFTVSLPIRTHPASPESFRRSSPGRLDSFRDALGETLTAMRDVGVTATWLPTPGVEDIEEYLDSLRWAATEVVPLFRDAPAG